MNGKQFSGFMETDGLAISMDLVKFLKPMSESSQGPHFQLFTLEQEKDFAVSAVPRLKESTTVTEYLHGKQMELVCSVVAWYD